MPVKELMGWDEKEARWQKFFLGRNHKRSPKQLAKEFPDLVTSLSKTGTRDAANRWWESKELDLIAENEPTLEELVKQDNRDKKQTKKMTELALERIANARPIARLAGLTEETDISNLNESQVKLIGEAIHLALNNQLPKPEVDTEKTISGQLEIWLTHRHRLAKLKEKNPEKHKDFPSLATYKQNKAHSTTIKDYVTSDEVADSIEAISSSYIADFRDFLIDKVEEDELVPKSALNILGAFSLFVDWLSLERELIVRPNLMSKRGWKKLSFDPIPYPMTPETFKAVYDKADDLTRLYLLLMANCGYTAKDISDLTPSQVDWKQGRIKRKRSKAVSYSNSPVVDRPLWPETFQLLKQFGSKKDDRVLTSESGAVLVTTGRKDLVGERVKDAILEAGFQSGPHYRPKDIRSGCATLIDASKKYDGWETYFLGHTPHSGALPSYVGHNGEKQSQFDELTIWLRSQWLS